MHVLGTINCRYLCFCIAMLHTKNDKVPNFKSNLKQKVNHEIAITKSDTYLTNGKNQCHITDLAQKYCIKPGYTAI